MSSDDDKAKATKIMNVAASKLVELNQQINKLKNEEKSQGSHFREEGVKNRLRDRFNHILETLVHAFHEVHPEHYSTFQRNDPNKQEKEEGTIAGVEALVKKVAAEQGVEAPVLKITFGAPPRHR